jgi:hypothetical protein
MFLYLGKLKQDFLFLYNDLFRIIKSQVKYQGFQRCLKDERNFGKR